MHYAKTSEAWLQNMDANRKEIWPLFEETYGADKAKRWWVYWRVFFMAFGISSIGVILSVAKYLLPFPKENKPRMNTDFHG